MAVSSTTTRTPEPTAELLERSAQLTALEDAFAELEGGWPGAAGTDQRRGRRRQDGARAGVLRRAGRVRARPLGRLRRAVHAEAARAVRRRRRPDRRRARRRRARRRQAVRRGGRADPRAGGAARRRSSSSTTCTGPTRRRSTCSRWSAVASTAWRPRSSWPPIGTTSSTSGTRFASWSASWPGRKEAPPPRRAAIRRRRGSAAGCDGIEADELYRRTEGNPFFVTEVLAAGGQSIPATVRDAVLARAGRLSPSGRRLLEAAAVVPSGCEHGLLERLAPEEIRHLAECLASGILVDAGAAVRFRHELARLALEESIELNRRLLLHRTALEALASAPEDDHDPARLAHHAEGAGDTDAVLRIRAGGGHARGVARSASRVGRPVRPRAQVRR